MINYDKVLSAIGEFGSYQKRLCVFLCILVIPNSIHITSTVFNNILPSSRCAVPGLTNDTYHIQNDDHERLVKASIPYDKDLGHFSQCYVYANLENREENATSPGISNNTQLCQKWVYDVKDSRVSLAMEFDLVCDRAIYKAHINMMILLGILVGSLLGGALSDFFGRKRMVVLGIILQNLVAASLAFVNSVPQVMAVRFCLTVIGSTMFLAVVVLLTEVVGASKRSIAAMASMVGFTLGLFVLALVQYIFGDWRTAQLVHSLPFLVFFVFWWLTQESPRWLLNKNKTEEAQNIIAYIAKVNKAKLPPMAMESSDGTEMIKPFEDQRDEETVTQQIKIWHICCRSGFVTRLVILCFSWIVINMVYYGLVLGVGDLIEGDIFVNFTLQGLMELVSHVICIFVLERTGRRRIFCADMILSSVSTLGMGVLILAEADIRWVSISLFCVGKLCITMAFSLIFIVTAELLPTTIRNSGLGFCSFVARFSGIVSPYIVSASLLIPGPFGEAFPLLLFGALSLMSGLSALWLPETQNAKLTDNFDGVDKAIEI